MTTDIMLTLALLEMSGSVPNDTAIDAMSCAISDRLRTVNPAWIVAFRMAHSDHSTIRFDANYCTPVVFL